MQSLQEAKTYLKENYEKGTKCPCCGQFVKLYKRKITSAMALGLIYLAKNTEADEYVHIENFFKKQPVPSSIRGDISKLVFWGLLEKQEGLRADGSSRNGYYKITQLGRNFVHGLVTVSKNIFIYNNKVIKRSDELINIETALGNKFNYRELMK